MLQKNGFCTAETNRILLDAGTWPISNRYLSRPDEPQERYPYVLGQCQKSGLISLLTPFPVEALVPRVSWMVYNEPEAHLDQMVEQLLTARGGRPGVAAGLSLKDDSTLTRLEAFGWKTWRPNPETELGLPPNAGAESLQRFRLEQAERLLQVYPPVDLLIVRHIFEHVYDPTAFLDACRRLLAPGGQLVIEIPDCSRALELPDYTTLWEEHLFYFTPATFRWLMALHGFGEAFFASYPYPFEDSLVVLLEPESLSSARPVPRLTPEVLAQELARGQAFGQRLGPLQVQVKQTVKALAGEGAVALMGAGHLALTFLELFDLSGSLSCIIDDNPHKQGLFMPGSGLPIVSSRRLLETPHGQLPISLCLLGLNPMNEEKVVQRQSAFVAKGGTFKSIFPISHRALQGGEA